MKKIEPYCHVTFHEREKVYYLNKEGRSLINSEKEVKKNQNIEHTLLRNEAYLFLRCPYDWRNEVALEYEVTHPNALGIILKGMNVATKGKIVCDAMYSRNGYTHIVEIDNKQDMKENHKKIKSYVEVLKHLDTPKIEIFTTTLDRKRKFEQWLQDYKIRGDVLIYEEIR